MAKNLKVATIFKGQDQVTGVLGQIERRTKSAFQTMGRASDVFKHRTKGLFSGTIGQALSLKTALGAVAGAFTVGKVFQELADAKGALEELRDSAEGVRNMDAGKLREVASAFAQLGSSRATAIATVRALNTQLEALRSGGGKVAKLLDQQIKIARPEDAERLRAFRAELLLAQDPVEALHAIMRTFAKDPDAALPFLTSAMGRKNANDIVRIIKEGGTEALKAEQLAARVRLGTDVSKAADAADAIGDALERSRDVWDGIKFKALEQMAPIATKALDDLSGYLATNKDSIAKGIVSIFESVRSALEWFVENRQLVKDAMLAFVAYKATSGVLGTVRDVAMTAWAARGMKAPPVTGTPSAPPAGPLYGPLPKLPSAPGSPGLLGTFGAMTGWGLAIGGAASALDANPEARNRIVASDPVLQGVIDNLRATRSATQQPVAIQLEVTAPAGSTVSATSAGGKVSVHNLGRRTAGAMP